MMWNPYKWLDDLIEKAKPVVMLQGIDNPEI